MPEYVSITIRIPRETWETIKRATLELQDRAREQGMTDVVFDSYVHAATLLEQAIDIEQARLKWR